MVFFAAKYAEVLTTLAQDSLAIIEWRELDIVIAAGLGAGAHVCV